MIEIINGKEYEKLPDGHLEAEIQRREDEIARFTALLAQLQLELDEMKGKAVEKEVQVNKLLSEDLLSIKEIIK